MISSCGAIEYPYGAKINPLGAGFKSEGDEEKDNVVV
jgi:hypothetical protein